jgi:hypothetical protein
LNFFYKNIEKDRNDQILSNEFVLPYYQNQIREEVCVENNIQIGSRDQRK